MQSKKNTKRNIFNHTKEEPRAQFFDNSWRRAICCIENIFKLYYENGGFRHPTKVAAPTATKKDKGGTNMEGLGTKDSSPPQPLGRTTHTRCSTRS